jgi:hypothetical protein
MFFIPGALLFFSYTVNQHSTSRFAWTIHATRLTSPSVAMACIRKELDYLQTMNNSRRPDLYIKPAVSENPQMRFML